LDHEEIVLLSNNVLGCGSYLHRFCLQSKPYRRNRLVSRTNLGSCGNCGSCRLTKTCHFQGSNSFFRNHEHCSTLWTFYTLSWLFASVSYFKALETKQVSARQQSRILQLASTQRAHLYICRHS